MSRALALVVTVLTACTSGDQPRLSPASLAMSSETQPLLVDGLPAVAFLSIDGDDLSLARDYLARIGDTDTVVQAADATGVTLTLSSSLPIGSYPLELTANGQSWHVDDALAITGADPGGTSCPAAPAGCTAFSCVGSPSCYYVCEGKSATAAESQCEAHGLGCLATIGDLAEEICLTTNATPSEANPVWIGLAAAEDASSFAWTCGSGSYTDWSLANPDASTDKARCVEMSTLGAWDDRRCDETHRYVCER